MRTSIVLLHVVFLVAGSIPYPAAAREKTDAPFHRAAADAPAAQSLFLYPERTCLASGQIVSYESGTLYVPMNRSDPDSPVISIEVCRFKADDEQSKLPPLFNLHGGPGFPGLGDPSIEYLENNVWPITRELGADYVVVGQRGDRLL